MPGFQIFRNFIKFENYVLYFKLTTLIKKTNIINCLVVNKRKCIPVNILHECSIMLKLCIRTFKKITITIKSLKLKSSNIKNQNKIAKKLNLSKRKNLIVGMNV